MYLNPQLISTTCGSLAVTQHLLHEECRHAISNVFRHVFYSVARYRLSFFRNKEVDLYPS